MNEHYSSGVNRPFARSAVAWYIWNKALSTPIRFSNENETVLLRFQKDLRPHVLFSYRFRRPHYNAVSALKTLLYPQCACSNELGA